MATLAAANAKDYTRVQRSLSAYASSALLRLRLQAGLNALAIALTCAAWLLVLLLLAGKLFSLKQLGIDVWAIWGGVCVMAIPFMLWRMFSGQLHAQRAAVLTDDRLGLHARLSSALTLDFTDPLNAGFADAFLHEAMHKMAAVKVEQAFPLRIPRAFGWLMVPGLLAGGIFYGMKDQDILGIAAKAEQKRKAEERQQQTAKKLEGKLEDLKKEMEKKGDEQGGNFKVNQLIEKAEKVAKDLKEGQRDKDEALLGLGSLKQDIEKEKERISQGKDFLDRLEKLQAKDLNLEESDLTKYVSEALKMGDPGQAAKEMRKLAQKIKDEILNDPKKTDEQKKQDLDKLKNELEKLSDALIKDEALRDGLREMAKSSMSAADYEKLQKEIKEQLNKQNKGDKKFGDDIERDANRIADELERLEEDNDTKLDEDEQNEMDELDKVEEGIDDAIDNLTDEGLPDENGMQQGKNGQGGKTTKQQGGNKAASGNKSMRGRAGKKQGGQQQGQNGKDGNKQGNNGQGQGQGKDDGNKNGQPGDGLGSGQGIGHRPYRDGNAEFEKQKVKGELRQGAITGISHFRGQGAKGDAPKDFTTPFEAAEKEAASSLELERIPADAREMVKDYFTKVREGAGLPPVVQPPAPQPAPTAPSAPGPKPPKAPETERLKE